MNPKARACISPLFLMLVILSLAAACGTPVPTPGKETYAETPEDCLPDEKIQSRAHARLRRSAGREP